MGVIVISYSILLGGGSGLSFLARVGWPFPMSFAGDMPASACLFLNVLTTTGIANVSI
jgi:hypothetical protein